MRVELLEVRKIRSHTACALGPTSRMGRSISVRAGGSSLTGSGEPLDRSKLFGACSLQED